MEPHRIFVTGGAGSGKTTLVRRLVRLNETPLYDLDGIALAQFDDMPKPVDYVVACELLKDRASELAAAPHWVCDGSFIGWTGPFLERADIIVWMHVTWRVASYRILMRHTRAELARNNRFPGWRRLLRFWRWNARWYSNRNPDGLNEGGTPRTYRTLEAALVPYAGKVVRYERVDEAVSSLQGSRQAQGA